LPGGTGVAWLALRSKAPVIPVFIHNAPRSSSMVWAFFTCTRTTLTYGPPIDLSRWYKDKPSRSDLVEVTDLIMSRLAEMGGLRTSPTIE
jgi:1-acyl-sn-glycerol-3-phosphate acyltransferase